MGGCCSGASKPSEENLPASQNRGRTPPHQATVSPLSTELLVDTNPNASAPDTYEEYDRNPPTSSENEEELKCKSEDEVPSQPTNAETLENQEPHARVEKVEELEGLMEIDDGDFEVDLNLKKSTEPYVPPLSVEDDVCPICLEEYDEENPKMSTKCDHLYHLACILEWMERSDSCPMCDEAIVLSSAFEGL